MEQQVHLAEEVRHGLGFYPEQAPPLQPGRVLGLLALRLQMLECLNEEAAGPRGGVKDRLGQARIRDGHDEPHEGSGCVELTGVAGGVAHLLEERLLTHFPQFEAEISVRPNCAP
jgi:hypothetical protein